MNTSTVEQMLNCATKHSQSRVKYISGKAHIIVTWIHKYQNKRILRNRPMLIIEIPRNGNISYYLNEIIAESTEIKGVSKAQDRLCELWRGYTIILFEK